MPTIVPKSKAPKVDFCGVDEYYYIIRADLNVYMRSTNFNKGKDLSVFNIHQACQDGDHYLAHEDDFFYVIKGNFFRRVSNLNKDSGAIVQPLHPNCCGGDHYLSAFGHFYIIYQSKKTYRKVTNLSTDGDAVEYTLHPNCRNGLYYWGIKNYYYFVVPHDKWGIQYFRCTDFAHNENSETFSFHNDVIPFLPGGLSITHGPAYGRWEAIKTLNNDSKTPITLKKSISKKVGYSKEKMQSVENSWNISMSYTYQTGTLMEALCKQQLSLSAEYGGKSVNATKENWEEATEMTEEIELTLQPGEKVYIWQYKLGLGKDDILFCRDMKFDDDANPPTEIPLPPARE
ncbi:uncharacterized protein LOC133366756 [Rhineura floridana]|uniref:uncharacterized protein LOC133366756 n=1 Tax=Rhineura floridana TaxID=261503 RepID=UPI002AC7F1FE|nr:uncharacterized protein LOC133366756 [Rhineura floridana]